MTLLTTSSVFIASLRWRGLAPFALGECDVALRETPREIDGEFHHPSVAGCDRRVPGPREIAAHRSSAALDRLVAKSFRPLWGSRRCAFHCNCTMPNQTAKNSPTNKKTPGKAGG